MPRLAPPALLLLVVLAMVSATSQAIQSVITVNSTDDPGQSGDDRVTLREAIAFANGTLAPAGGELALAPLSPGAESADLITFQIEAGRPVMILVQVTPLPALTGANDSIQGGEDGVVIVPSPTLSEPAASGLKVQGQGITLQSLILTGFPGEGVAVTAGGTVQIIDCLLDGNSTGLLVSGPESRATITSSLFGQSSRAGVWVNNGASATLSRSVISNNTQAGVLADGGQVTVSQSQLAGNDSAVTVLGTGQATLRANSLVGNQLGVVVAARGSSARLEGNSLANTAQHGVVVDQLASAELTGNELSGSGLAEEVDGAALLVQGGAQVLASDNLLTDNELGVEVRPESTATLTGNTITGSRFWGTLVTGSATLTANQLLNNGLDQSRTGAGVAVQQGGQARLEGNTLTGNQLGVDLADPGTQAVLAQNTIVLSRLSAVLVRQGARGVLSGNILADNASDPASAALLVTSGATISASENLVDRGRLGIMASDAGTTIELRGNTVRRQQLAGVTITASAQGTLLANFLLDNTTAVQVRHGAQARLEDNVITSNQAGIMVADATSSAQLQGNQLREQRQVGLLVTSSATIEARDNQFQDNGSQITPGEGAAVGSSGAQLILEGNTFSRGTQGISLRDQGTTARVRENTFAYQLGPAVLVASGALATLEGNQISGAGAAPEGTDGALVVLAGQLISQGDRLSGNEQGITVSQQGNALLQGTSIADSAQHGIVVEESGTTTLRQVQLSANQCGLAASGPGAQATIEASTLTANRTAGVCAMAQASVTLRSSTVQNNSLAGVSISSGAQVTVTGSTLAHNGSGLLADNGQLTAGENIISGNSTGVVLQNGASATLSGNTITANHQDGVNARELVSAVLSQNVISDNGASGIAVTGSHLVTITGNTLAGNAGSALALEGLVTLADNTVDGQQFPGVRVNIGSATGPLVLAPMARAALLGSNGIPSTVVQFFNVLSSPAGPGRAALVISDLLGDGPTPDDVAGVWVDGLAVEVARALAPGFPIAQGQISLVTAYPTTLGLALRGANLAVNLTLLDFGPLLTQLPPAEALITALPRRLRLTINGRPPAGTAPLSLEPVTFFRLGSPR
ncbi:MAG: right-handed parallel beta-helix repeat-containing protein [Deinococcus sp.]|nr:right-handed parallel beta-helix repeat-containing protein [Deinococcus sp.]